MFGFSVDFTVINQMLRDCSWFYIKTESNKPKCIPQYIIYVLQKSDILQYKTFSTFLHAKSPENNLILKRKSIYWFPYSNIQLFLFLFIHFIVSYSISIYALHANQKVLQKKTILTKRTPSPTLFHLKFIIDKFNIELFGFILTDSYKHT